LLRISIGRLQIDILIFYLQFPDATSENWQHLLGSIASYEYQSGMLSTATESNRKDMTDTQGNLEDRYAKLETEKEILNVDFDKMKVEKNHMEEQLLEWLEVHRKLQTNLEHVSEEKEELQKMLDESYAGDVQGKNDQQKLKEMVVILEAKVTDLNEELKKETERSAKVLEEKEKSIEEYQTQINKRNEYLKQLQQRQTEMENAQVK
jgi:chromosome segregation ATPase